MSLTSISLTSISLTLRYLFTVRDEVEDNRAPCNHTELHSVTRSQTVVATCVRIFRANQALRLLAVFVLLLLPGR